MNETCREYERIVDPKYLEQIRAQVKGFTTKCLCRQSALAECAIRSFKNGKNTIRPRSLRKLIRAIHDLQNKPLSANFKSKRRSAKSCLGLRVRQRKS